MHKLWFHKNDDIALKFLADEILADCSQNRQSTKINSPPKFPAIRYMNLKPLFISTSLPSCMYVVAKYFIFRLFICCLSSTLIALLWLFTILISDQVSQERVLRIFHITHPFPPHSLFCFGCLYLQDCCLV